MTEPHELIDETELLFYEIVFRELQRQLKLIGKSPQAVFNEGFWDNEVALLVTAFLPFLTNVTASGVMFGLGDLASVVSVDPVIENARTYATQFTGEFINRINSTSRMQVQDLLARSVDEGWSVRRLEAELSPLFGEQRARLIAITETTNAYQGGARFAMDELRGQGFDATLVWSTVRDSRVCQICEERDGKEIGEIDEELGRALWDEEGSAHPGCRCNVIVKIRD